MITAIIIFICAAIYAFYDYYRTKESKTLIFSFVLLASAIFTLVQTCNDNKQSNNIEKLSKLDTSLSHHIDTLASIDTSISSSTNGIVGNIFHLSQQNIILSDSINKLDSEVFRITQVINRLSKSTNSLANKLDIKTDVEFAVSGKFDLKLNPNIPTAKILMGGQTYQWPRKRVIGRGKMDVNQFNNPYQPLPPGVAPLFFQITNDSLLISGKLFDEAGNVIIEIENNEWRVNKSFISKFNFDDKGLEIFNQKGIICLSINILTDNRIEINELITSDKGPIVASPYGYYYAHTQTNVINFFKSNPYKPLFKYTGNKWHGVRIRFSNSGR